MHNYLADTTVLIENLRRNPQAKTFLTTYSPSISTVSKAELIQGSRDKHELAAVLKMCTSLSEITINSSITHTSIELLQNFNLSHGLLFLDALIAATAIEKNFILVTENVKDFRFIPNLQITPQNEIFS